MATNGQEIVVAPRTDLGKAFVPGNLNDAWSLAENLAKSALLPAHLRGKTSDVFVTLLLGHDLGLTPMQAITGIFVIEGKPGVSSQTAVGLVKKSPLCKYFVADESTDSRAAYSTHRLGDPAPQRREYTIEQARNAGLSGKATWKSHPAAMLRARAAMSLARDVYPDVVGSYYSEDEIDEIRERAAAEVITAPPMPGKEAPIVGMLRAKDALTATPSAPPAEKKTRAKATAAPPPREDEDLDKVFGTPPAATPPAGEMSDDERLALEVQAAPTWPDVRALSARFDTAAEAMRPTLYAAYIDKLIALVRTVGNEERSQIGAEFGRLGNAGRLTGEKYEAAKAAYSAGMRGEP